MSDGRSHSRLISPGWMTGIALLLVGCASDSYHMGDPLRASAKAGAPQASALPAPASGQPPAEYRSGAAQRQANEWELKWQQIQSPADAVNWIDHFHVCGLKYRFRNYDQLFRCLDLLDAKIAAGGPRVKDAELVRAGAPVLTGWLRASAYAELGEQDNALKWAQSAWGALPEAYRQADSIVTQEPTTFRRIRADLKPVYYVGAELGSWGFGLTNGSMDTFVRAGRNNPEALEYEGSMVTMALAVQRCLLYQRLGEQGKANAALADLRRWEQTRYIGPHRSAGKIRPYIGRAQLLSIGPLFAQGDYATVVRYYEVLAHKIGARRDRDSALNTVEWTLFFPITLYYKGLTELITHAVAPRDVRLFAIAVDDVSNALIYAQSLQRLGRTNDARAMLDTLLALPEIRGMGNLYWVTLYERGRIALEQGQRAQGIRLLEQSVDAIESVRSTISFEAGKIGFAGDKQTVYATLIGALATGGDWRGAFVYAERAKARALVDLLAQRRDLAPPPSADNKVRELLASAATPDSSLGLAASDEGVRSIKVVADARGTLADVAPEAASLISVQKIDVAAIVSRLGPEESLVDYYMQGDTLYAFVLTSRSIKGQALSARGLQEQVRAFRAAIGRRDPLTGQLARGLYDRTLRPVLGDVQGSKLTVAPHGVLHYVPFAALSDGDHYLLERFSLRLTPSADALVYLRADAPRKLGKLLALGNPDLGQRQLDLPNAETEALKVASMFPNSRALVRAQASKSAVEDLANGFAIVHFATHGHFDADAPLASGLYLAKGSAADGVLTVSDLYALRWDVDLVTLSACETGLGKIASGDDVIGLTRGFFYAGARSIVASLWEVDDAATAQLMVSFYRNLGAHDKREALRLAQLETRQRYPDPWYWAAFIVLGRAD